MNDNNEIILKVGVDDDQAMAELRLLEQKINEIINKDGSGKTFAELKKEIKGITEFTKLMKTHGLDGTREFTVLTNKAKELRVYSNAIRKEFGELSNGTFEQIANQAAKAATQTEHFAQTVSVVGSEVNTSNQGMAKMHGLLEFADRTSSVEGLGGAFGFLNSMLGFSTQAMGEYGSANGTAERAMAQAEKAQQALEQAVLEGRDTTQLAERATQAQTVATEAATTASKAFKMALVSIGIGIFILGLQTLIENWDKVANMIDKNISKKKQLSEVYKTAANDASKEISQLRTLYQVATDHTKSLEDRTNAVKKLQSEYPSYFKNLSSEDFLVGKAAKSYNNLTNAILASSIAKAAQAKIDERVDEGVAKYLGKMKDVNEAQKEMDKWASKAQKYPSAAAAYMNTFKYWEDVRDKAQKTANDLKKEFGKGTEDLQKLIDENTIKAKPLEKDREAAKAPNAAKDNSKSDELKRQLEEINKINADARVFNEKALLDETQKKLYDLDKSFNAQKTLYDKHGKDVSEITKKYETEKNKIISDHTIEATKQDEEARKKIEDSRKEHLKKMAAIETDRANLKVNNLETDFSLGADEINFQKQIDFIDRIQAAKIEALNAAFEEEKLRLGEDQSEIELLTEQHEARKRQIEAESAKDKKAIRKAEVQSAVAGVEQMGQAFDQLSGIMEEGTLGQKALGIASSTISMFTAIVKTWEGYASMGPFGVAGAIAQSAAIAASGIVNIKKIAAVKVNGKTGNSSVPNIDAANFQSAPIVNAQQAQGNNDVRITNPDDMMIRAYIPESDLDDANRRKQFMDNLGGY